MPGAEKNTEPITGAPFSPGAYSSGSRRHPIEEDQMSSIDSCTEAYDPDQASAQQIAKQQELMQEEKRRKLLEAATCVIYA